MSLLMAARLGTCAVGLRTLSFSLGSALTTPSFCSSLLSSSCPQFSGELHSYKTSLYTRPRCMFYIFDSIQHRAVGTVGKVFLFHIFTLGDIGNNRFSLSPSQQIQW